MDKSRIDLVEYSRFAQYFTENADNLDDLKEQAEELISEGKEVPTALASEIFRHKVIVDILTQAGEERYGKSPETLYQDGWHFWFIENKQLK